MNNLVKRNFFSEPFLRNTFFDNSSFFESKHLDYPLANIRKEKGKKIIDLMAAGYDKNDFAVELDNGVLSISAKKEFTEESFERKEYMVNEFSRKFFVGKEVEEKDIKASYNSGILLIEVPEKKNTEKPKSKLIQIE